MKKFKCRRITTIKLTSIVNFPLISIVSIPLINNVCGSCTMTRKNILTHNIYLWKYVNALLNVEILSVMKLNMSRRFIKSNFIK